MGTHGETISNFWQWLRQLKKQWGEFDKYLVAIIVFAVFFRFYRLLDFQYWSVDEEIFVAVVRQAAANHKLILLSPNTVIELSLGSFFHLLSAPIFWLGNFTASQILIAGSALGVATTIAVYKIGKEFGGPVVARIASLLYAGSFLVAFCDRRWWPLTLDPLLCLLAIFSMTKIINGHLRYSLLFAISASFAWHADPSLAVITVFGVLALIIFKIPLWKKEHLLALAYLLFSISPFIFFEIRHPGAITHPAIKLLTSHSGSILEKHMDLVSLLQGFTRSLFLMPRPDMERYFRYLPNYPAPLGSPLSEIITLGLLLLPLRLLNSNQVKLLYLYLLAFLTGVLVYTWGMGASFHQHYYVVVWPIFFLLAAFAIKQFPKILGVFIIGAFLITNFWNLFFASMHYPLIMKEKLVDQALAMVDNKPFALEVGINDRYFDGIGALFYLKNRFPINADYYEAFDWIYRAYSLYEISPTKGPFETTVTIFPDHVDIRNLKLGNIQNN